MSDSAQNNQGTLDELAELRRDASELHETRARLKQAEHALRESEDVLEAISQQSLMGIVLLQDFRVVYTNDTYSGISEYSLEEILEWTAQDLLQLVHPEDKEFVIGQLGKKMAGETDGLVTAYTYRGVTKHGKVRWLSQHSRTVHYRGKPADLVTLVDITEQKEAELAQQRATDELEQRVTQRTEELERTNETLQHESAQRRSTEDLLRTEREQLLAIFDNIDAPIYVCDTETYEVLFANRTLQDLFGDVMGEKCHEAFHEFDAPCRFCPQEHGALEAAEGAHIWEFRNRLTGRWYHVIDQSLIWTDGRKVRLEIAIDIDERVRAKKQLEAAYAELQELDRLKDDFISNVSHELRTPMVSAKGYAELLMTKDVIDESDRERIRRIHRGVTRLEVLIEDLLDFSQLATEAGALEDRPVDLAAVVRRCEQLVEPRRKERKVRIDVDLPADLPPIRGDEGKLQTAVRNLLDNAVKFSEEGGAVRVEARPGAPAEVELAVTDDGIGIAPSHHDRIFTRFFQVDSSSTRLYTGAGIGLALTREIVERHGGSIQVESELGRGATFRVNLPIA